ncbi:hypothetical protein B0H66DRAFT_565628 [Apodospora peruviana]|uniref:Uncharacterized protein n=1 Tax=Apodospora peruviana TaxID=516989 RepID=A0AAE0HZ42_9PEZI|nr:hypothetical protein B0H66DRAFT_565628 [Apodospora peruviana]
MVSSQWRWSPTTLLFLSLSLLTIPTLTTALDFVPNAYSYCIKYYGSVSASISLGEGWLGKNYNNTITCPTSWDFPTLKGATLTLCPPESNPGGKGPFYAPDARGLAIDAKLEFRHVAGILEKPIDHLALTDFLITNGSVKVPDGKPAVLAPHDWSRSYIGPQWSINGTEESIVSEPKRSGGGVSLYLDCANLSNKQRGSDYCGTGEDEDVGGCWRSQTFVFNMQDRMNFSIGFHNFEAEATVFAGQDWVYRNGTNMGTSEVVLTFAGRRELPSVVDYDFWINSEMNYESEKEDLNDQFRLEEDATGMPLFLNATQSGEWFDTANGTFSVLSGANRGGVAGKGVVVMWASMVVFVGWYLV